MPLYEYKCKQCHRHTEKILHFSDPEETVCPHCGGTLERVISAPAIQFKGAGWYVNDYAKSGAKHTTPAAHTDGSEGKSSDSGKSESSKDSGGSTAAASSSSDASASNSSDSSAASSKNSSPASASSGSTGKNP